MSSPATGGTKTPPPASWRWAVLIAISVAMFGNYYAYDSIGPVADSLQKILGFSDTQIGTLNAIYSFPNIIMVLIGGIIVDRFGARLSTFVFASICTLGAVITALSPNFYVMAAGRLIFGLGAESMIVAITVIIGQWFIGRQLGFAFGVNLAIARAGLVRRGHVHDVVQAVVRHGVATAVVAGRRVRVADDHRLWRLLRAGSARRRAVRSAAAESRPIASPGTISGVSIAPTGTSSVSV